MSGEVGGLQALIREVTVLLFVNCRCNNILALVFALALVY